MAKVLKNVLSDHGYNLVQLPKEDIAPLLLLYKNKDAVSSVESPVTKLFQVADAAPPVIVRDKIVTNIQGAASIELDAEGGVTLLDWLLQKLKMGKLGSKLQIDATNKVKISYENIKEDKIDLLDLDNFISGSEPDVNKFNSFRDKLEDSEMYVVTAVLKSNSFSVSVEDHTGNQVDVEATVKGILDTDVNVTKKQDNAITLSQGNATPIVFAFKAQRIIYDKKKWWQVFKKDEAKFRIQDQQGVVLKADEDFSTQPLEEETTLVDI